MVGYTLRQERERQNLTVEDIEQGTSIRTVYIEAIENGEYDKLPGAIYTKGFIKNYAKFLNIDADAAAKEFSADLAELKAEKDAEAAKIAAAQASEQQNEQQIEIKQPKSEKKSIGYSIRQDQSGFSPKILIAAVFLGVIVLFGGIWTFSSDSDGEMAVKPPVEQEKTPEPEKITTSEPVASANPAPNDNLQIQARFNDSCWLLVTIDGAIVQEGIVDGGQTLTWEGKNDINFRLGNAGAVEFFQNGKSLGVLGGIGDVVDKTFTRN